MDLTLSYHNLISISMLKMTETWGVNLKYLVIISSFFYIIQLLLHITPSSAQFRYLDTMKAIFAGVLLAMLLVVILCDETAFTEEEEKEAETQWLSGSGDSVVEFRRRGSGGLRCWPNGESCRTLGFCWSGQCNSRGRCVTCGY